MQIFALDDSRPFGEKVADCLDFPLSPYEERSFEDGEHKARPLVSVRGNDVYVIQSLYGDPDASCSDKLCRMLFFLGTLRENGARRVTAVTPYLSYARKDRQTKARDPVTTKYMAQLFEAMGIDALVTLDVHNIVAFQNAFRSRSIHLDTRLLFAERAVDLVGDRPVVVASPDPGGVKRAQLFCETLEDRLGRPAGSAFMEKRRSRGKVTGTQFVGDVEGATVLVIDDLISTGGTIVRAAKACLDNGAKEVYAFAAHGLFVGNAAQMLGDQSIARTFVTDTVPPFRLDPSIMKDRLEILSAAPLFAEAIRRLHLEGSLVDMLAFPE
jgi:ribose-phosphate pyrophosphokinase